jgi:hypothetical protein
MCVLLGTPSVFQAFIHGVVAREGTPLNVKRQQAGYAHDKTHPIHKAKAMQQKKQSQPIKKRPRYYSTPGLTLECCST